MSLEEALQGGERTISVSQPGSKARSLKVTIPADAADGQRLRLSGQGARGPEGGRGDLYLQIHLRSHPRFRVEGHDLHTHLDLAPAVAALGAQPGPFDLYSAGRRWCSRGRHQSYMSPPGGAAAGFFFSGMGTTRASVMSRSPAMLAPFSRAVRDTLVGSVTPAGEQRQEQGRVRWGRHIHGSTRDMWWGA